MDLFNSIEYFSRKQIAAQAQIDELNKDYWTQPEDERRRRESEKRSALWDLAYTCGALHVLEDMIQQRAESNDRDPDDEDRALADDLLTAIRLADAGDPEYWDFIRVGGALGHAAWTRYAAERQALYSIPDDQDFTAEQWRRAHALDLLLGY